MDLPVLRWIHTLERVTAATAVTTQTFGGARVPLDAGVVNLRDAIRTRIKFGGRVYLIGNGGSLAMASHIATDFALAGWPSIALADSVALTSHTNDFGAEANFTKQLELLGTGRGDLLIALSCSGTSKNILDAARHAVKQRQFVVTLTGFDPENPLRRLGDLNFWVPAGLYGFVQLAHESILHAACDIESGWPRD